MTSPPYWFVCIDLVVSPPTDLFACTHTYTHTHTHTHTHTGHLAQACTTISSSTGSQTRWPSLTSPSLPTILNRSWPWPGSSIRGDTNPTQSTILCGFCRRRECCSGIIPRTLTDWKDVSGRTTNLIIRTHFWESYRCLSVWVPLWYLLKFVYHDMDTTYHGMVDIVIVDIVATRNQYTWEFNLTTASFQGCPASITCSMVKPVLLMVQL